MGYHFQNNSLLDATLDLGHPEVLVYEKMPDGTFQLNGVEFLVPISAWKSTEPPRIVGQALRRRIRSASGSFTSGLGNRIRAVFSLPGIPTSSVWRPHQ